MRTVALSTWCLDARRPPGAFLDMVRSLGDPPLLLDANLGEVAASELLLLARRRSTLSICAIEAPCPRPVGRAPRLATDDRDERRAAVAAATRTIQLAAELGAAAVVLRLGSLRGPADWSEATRAFARGALEPSSIEHMQSYRSQVTPLALDMARFALEPLVGVALGAGVVLALANRARWLEIPDHAELAALLGELVGAPVAPWFDPAAAHARESLGFGTKAAWLAAFGKRTIGAWLTDACGVVGGLPWGRGDIDTQATMGALGDNVLAVVHCAPGVTDEEIAGALAFELRRAGT